MLIHHLFKFPDRISNVMYTSLLSCKGITVEYILGDFGKICVAMYLFLSGYGLYITFVNKNKFTFKDSINKIIKVMKVYWSIFILFVPIGLIFYNTTPRYAWNLGEFIKNFLTLSNSYNNEWWFLGLYVRLILFFPIIIKMIDKNVKFLLTII